MFERYSERARETLRFASEEAAQRGAAEITPEHILLALIKDGSTLANGQLNQISPRRVRAEISSYLQPKGNQHPQGEAPLSQQSKALLAAAEKSADLLSHRDVSDNNILLGLMSIESCFAVQVLRRHGVSEEYPKKQIPPFNPDGLQPAERRHYDLERHLLELAQRRDYHGVLRDLDGALADPSLDRTLMIRNLSTFGYATAWALGDLNLAMHYEELRLQCDPDDILALSGAALCLTRLGRRDEAMEYARKCYQLSLLRSGAIAESLVESLEKQFPELKPQSPSLA